MKNSLVMRVNQLYETNYQKLAYNRQFSHPIRAWYGSSGHQRESAGTANKDISSGI